jgi:hypothetical protein
MAKGTCLSESRLGGHHTRFEYSHGQPSNLALTTESVGARCRTHIDLLTEIDRDRHITNGCPPPSLMPSTKILSSALPLPPRVPSSISNSTLPANSSPLEAKIPVVAPPSFSSTTIIFTDAVCTFPFFTYTITSIDKDKGNASNMFIRKPPIKISSPPRSGFKVKQQICDFVYLSKMGGGRIAIHRPKIVPNTRGGLYYGSYW